jgi:hypothetical protein
VYPTPIFPWRWSAAAPSRAQDAAADQRRPASMRAASRMPPRKRLERQDVDADQNRRQRPKHPWLRCNRDCGCTRGDSQAARVSFEPRATSLRERNRVLPGRQLILPLRAAANGVEACGRVTAASCPDAKTIQPRRDPCRRCYCGAIAIDDRSLEGSTIWRAAFLSE